MVRRLAICSGESSDMKEQENYRYVVNRKNKIGLMSSLEIELHKYYLGINTFSRQKYWCMEFRNVDQGTKEVEEKG